MPRKRATQRASLLVRAVLRSARVPTRAARQRTLRASMVAGPGVLDASRRRRESGQFNSRVAVSEALDAATSRRRYHRMSDEFVTYLFARYRGSRYVRRVASWIAFIVTRTEQLRDTDEWDIPRDRQLHSPPSVAGSRRATATRLSRVEGSSSARSRRSRSGMDLVLHAIASLEDAEKFYRQSRRFFTSKNA